MITVAGLSIAAGGLAACIDGCSRSDGPGQITYEDVQRVHEKILGVPLPEVAEEVEGFEMSVMAAQVGIVYRLPAGYYASNLAGRGRLPHLSVDADQPTLGEIAGMRSWRPSELVRPAIGSSRWEKGRERYGLTVALGSVSAREEVNRRDKVYLLLTADRD
jgi:hypothetical protein